MSSSSEDPSSRTTPRIYIASLSDYTAGTLLGRWVDANQPVEDIHRHIAELLAESKELVAEEWAIHDYENFGSLRLSEYEDLTAVAEVAHWMEVHGTLFAELVAHFGGTSGIAEARVYMEDGYWGEYDDLGWYAASVFEDLHPEALRGLPDLIRDNIDWDAIGRDLELGGDVFTIQHGGKVHVFDANI
jgi:antirestriction protein